MVKIAICPHCSEELVKDDCYNIDVEDNYITIYITGHCPMCKKEFQWVEGFNFAGADEIKEVT